jgi:hypothetical protein
MQGRCIHCPFLGKFVKRAVLEAGQKKSGGPKRGDKPFTSGFFGEDPIDDIANTSYEHKKYCYMPSVDFLDSSNLIYNEDIENTSPLKEMHNIK